MCLPSPVTAAFSTQLVKVSLCEGWVEFMFAKLMDEDEEDNFQIALCEESINKS